ncbi:sugar phosphate isomerase/epimerase [Salinibacterium sp. SYSU T00001]|uniref:sugar phosphate isomerase/epimerase n=1 Tax=Homoserinimonas sedimenticola TaxID=2986805 RepID=UPI0022368676|nr:sugar phosphate isomerase/epimerase [Salinibacterium sedimenticola]MCW4385897.1 sugar phosphate isomerase/epimerase [Salinibacterium sedimenticola]
MPNGLIQDDSLRQHPEGFALSLTLPWYRSLWLSSVTSLAVTIDGEDVATGDLAFELAGRRYALEELPEQSETLWYLQEHPLLIARREQPLALGETHEVAIAGELRLPYMQIAPGQDGGPGMYVPNFVRQTLSLTVTDRDAPAPAMVSDVTPPPPATEADPFKLGLTLYSASAEFRAGWFDFDGLLDRVAELGIGPGIEIVASQMIPSYPRVSDDFERTWRAAFDRHGFDASSYGANLDMGRRRDRDMTPNEEFEFSEQMFRSAHRLGFPLVRIQSAKPALLTRLLPIAEELELQLAYEIHAPLGPNSPEIMKVRELYDELDSPLLGFVADFSSTMHSMSPTLLRAVRRAGLDDEAIVRLQQIWATDAPMRERQEEFIGYLKGRDFDPGRLGSFAHLAFNMHGHVDPREWGDIMPQIKHVHAKFYDIDESGQEPAIDYPELVRVFVEGGYRGYWSSEWEGHAFAELGEVDPLLLVRKQHDLIRTSMRAVTA